MPARGPLWCDRTHDHHDPALGQPLCRNCYDYIGHVLFSWHAPDSGDALRFSFGASERQLRDRAENREHAGVIHERLLNCKGADSPTYHAVIRLDAASEPANHPRRPDTLSARVTSLPWFASSHRYRNNCERRQSAQVRRPAGYQNHWMHGPGEKLEMQISRAGRSRDPAKYVTNRSQTSASSTPI